MYMIYVKRFILYIYTEFADVFQSGLPVIKWHGIVEDDIEEEATNVVCEQINFSVLF